MPVLGAPQTPTALSSGERVAVLNAENLGSGSLTMAVSLTPQPTPALLSIYNNSTVSVTLCASPDLTSADFLPVYYEGTEITVPTLEVWSIPVSPGLYYAIKAGAAITAGTVWLAR